MEKINYKCLFFLFVFKLLSCSLSNQEHVDANFINALSEEVESTIPSKYSSYYLFIKCGNNKAAETNISELRYIYEHKYNAIKFSAFLNKAFNKGIQDSLISHSNCFDLDPFVYRQYRENKFDDFLNIYKDKRNSKYLNLLKMDSKSKTVFYLLFINNYCVAFDDYIGRFIYKRNSEF